MQVLFSPQLLSGPVPAFRAVVSNTFGAGGGDALHGASATTGGPVGTAAGEGPDLEGSEHGSECSDVYLLFSAVGQPVSCSWTGGAKVERGKEMSFLVKLFIII